MTSLLALERFIKTGKATKHFFASLEKCPEVKKVIEAYLKNYPIAKSGDLKFTDIPEDSIVAFSEGVQAALEKLGYDCMFDTTSPPDEKGNCTYEVTQVRSIERK